MYWSLLGLNGLTKCLQMQDGTSRTCLICQFDYDKIIINHSGQSQKTQIT